jgi:hypothetical protein
MSEELAATVTLTLTKEELEMVMASLDSTVKQGGLAVASHVMPLAVKVSQAGKDEVKS